MTPLSRLGNLGYATQLRLALYNGFRNVYSLSAVVAFTTAGIVWIIIHYSLIEIGNQLHSIVLTKASTVLNFKQNTTYDMKRTKIN